MLRASISTCSPATVLFFWPEVLPTGWRMEWVKRKKKEYLEAIADQQIYNGSPDDRWKTGSGNFE